MNTNEAKLPVVSIEHSKPGCGKERGLLVTKRVPTHTHTHTHAHTHTHTHTHSSSLVFKQHRSAVWRQDDKLFLKMDECMDGGRVK